MEEEHKLTWFKNAKYGLFIHFGLYSLLAGKWQEQETRGLAEWIQNDLDIPPDDYAQLASQFDPTLFNAKEIARKAKKWGMRYLCFTAKHHDGFALFDSKVSDFNSVSASPCKRDFVAELAQACQQEGLTFCLYYSQAQDWHHPGGYRAYHPNDPTGFESYFEQICLPQVRELLSNYGPIGMLWFDTSMEMSHAQSLRLVNLARELQPNCLINGRIGHGLGDYLTMADNRIPRQALLSPWEVPVTLNTSWGYKASDQNWTSPALVLEKLTKTVSRGGNLLLNIGPRGDGSIPETSEEILDRLGEHLKANGVSLFDTSAAQEYVFEFEGLYFTEKPGKLYVHLLNPERWVGKTLSLYHMRTPALAARILASGEELHLRVGKDLEGFGHWAIKLPASLQPENALAWIIEIDLASSPFEVEAL
jgi:alpha-L-fucosidase